MQRQLNYNDRRTYNNVLQCVSISLLERHSMWPLSQLGNQVVHISCSLLVTILAVVLASNGAAAEPEANAELPPLGPNVPNSFSEPETTLQYSWTPDKPIVYRFEFDISIAKEKRHFFGRNTLTPSKKAVVLSESSSAQKSGVGSGFVIHPEGIIVTCAHVVRGATSVHAVIGSKKFAARVISIDFDRDLAILRIPARNLPYLGLADSKSVRLADEVRVIGYPLSNLLGESVKVTRGEVSGIGGLEGKSGLQVDVSVNPGNSGGPLVDNSGRVVGVTSALLSGRGISEVGFAIPSNEVASLAKTLNIPVASNDSAKQLSPPDVVAMVSPATVLIKVERGLEGVGTGKPVAIDYWAYWHETPRPGRIRRLPSRPQDQHFNGSLAVDRMGEILQSENKAMLPCMLGDTSELGIEKLPISAPGSTTSDRPIAFQRTTRERNPAGFSPYGLHPRLNYGYRSPFDPGVHGKAQKRRCAMVRRILCIVSGKRRLIWWI